jgi:hypothetical protein
MDFTFELHGLEHEFGLLTGSSISSSGDLLDVAWKWRHISSTSTYHTLDPNPSVRSLIPKSLSQPIGLFNFGVPLIRDLSVHLVDHDVIATSFLQPPQHRFEVYFTLMFLKVGGGFLYYLWFFIELVIELPTGQ